MVKRVTDRLSFVFQMYSKHSCKTHRMQDIYIYTYIYIWGILFTVARHVGHRTYIYLGYTVYWKISVL